MWERNTHWLPFPRALTGDRTRSPGLLPDWDSHRQPITLQHGIQTTGQYWPGPEPILEVTQYLQNLKAWTTWGTYLRAPCTESPVTLQEGPVLTHLCAWGPGENAASPKFSLKPQWTRSGIFKVVLLNTVIKSDVYKYYNGTNFNPGQKSLFTLNPLRTFNSTPKAEEFDLLKNTFLFPANPLILCSQIDSFDNLV